MPDDPTIRAAIDLTHLPRILSRPPAVRVEFTWVNVSKPRRAFSYPDHLHLNYEILVPLAGDYRCSINGRPLIAQPGQAIVVQPGDRHADSLVRGQCYAAITFCLFWDISSPAVIFAANQSASARVVTVRLDDLVSLLVEEARRGDAMAGWRQDILTSEVLIRLLRAIPSARLQPTWYGNGRSERFAAAVEEVFRTLGSRRVVVPALARALGLRPTALTSAFRQHLGTTPAKALNRWRIEQARRLILHSELSVSAISERLGFSNPYHFSRVFSRITGQSPMSLRRKG